MFNIGLLFVRSFLSFAVFWFFGFLCASRTRFELGLDVLHCSLVTYLVELLTFGIETLGCAAIINATLSD